MKTYRVASREQHLFLGILCGGIGVVFLIGSAPSLLGWVAGNGKVRAAAGEGLLPVIVGLLAAWAGWGFGWRYLGQYPYRLCLADDRSIEFQRVLRSLTVKASDIRCIERTVAKLNLEGHDAREIVVWHARGRVVIPYFEPVEQFIAHVVALQPGIAVRGTWVVQS